MKSVWNEDHSESKAQYSFSLYRHSYTAFIKIEQQSFILWVKTQKSDSIETPIRNYNEYSALGPNEGYLNY